MDVDMDMGLEVGGICDPEQKQKLVFQHVFGIQPRHLKMNNFMEKKCTEKSLLCARDRKKLKLFKDFGYWHGFLCTAKWRDCKRLKI